MLYESGTRCCVNHKAGDLGVYDMYAGIAEDDKQGWWCS